LLLLVLGVAGCRAGDDTVRPLDESFETASTRALGQRRFHFPAGSGAYAEGDPRRGQSTTVTIGRFNPPTQLAAFSAVTEDGSIEGGYVELAELCSFVTLYRAIAGQPPVTPQVEGDVVDVTYYDSCGIDAAGRLGLYSEYEEVSLISEPSEAAPIEHSSRVALSSENVGATAEQAIGAFEMTLSASVMSYAIAADGPATTKWSAAHIHRGTAGSGGSVWLSLFDAEDVASYAILPSAGHIIASVFVTPEQASALELGTEEIYVDAHAGGADASLGGQIQPPIHPLLGIVASTQPEQTAGVPITDKPDQVRTSDSSGVVYELSVNGVTPAPPRALVLQLTPTAAVIGVPSSGPSVAAAVLGPSGKRFVAPVKLRFTLPESVDPSSLLAFHDSEDGAGPHFIPLFPRSFTEEGISVSLTHFSTVGLVQGDRDDLAADASTDPSSYEDFQGLMAEALDPSVLGQLLGSGSEELPPELANTIRGLLQDAVNQVLLPNLRAASTFDELTEALSDIAQWSNDAQEALGSLDGFGASLAEFRGALQGKVDLLLSGLEAQCLEAADSCKQREAAVTLSEWHANTGLLGTLLGDSIALPSLNTFCGGIMGSLVNHIEVTPSKLMVLEGGRFELEATPMAWNGIPIDTPVRWSSASPSVAVLDSENSGRGSAFAEGYAAIVASTPGACDVRGVAALNVRSLSGTWEVSTISSSHNCDGVSTSPALSIASVTQSLGGGLRATHPDYGTVRGSIDNLQTPRSGASPPPYRFSLGPVSSSDTPDCRDFLSDIDEFFSRGDIYLCKETPCRPISCKDTEVLNGTVGQDGIELRGDNEWSTDEIYEIYIGSPPAWERQTATCGGTDRVRAVVR
jgi:hypothetical protein